MPCSHNTLIILPHERTKSYFTGAIALVVGILMMIFHLQLADGGIIYAAGALFVGAGILNMTVFLGSRDKDGRTKMGAFGTAFGWIASAAAVVLGLAMLISARPSWL